MLVPEVRVLEAQEKPGPAVRRRPVSPRASWAGDPEPAAALLSLAGAEAKMVSLASATQGRYCLSMSLAEVSTVTRSIGEVLLGTFCSAAAILRLSYCCKRLCLDIAQHLAQEQMFTKMN